MEIEKWKAVDIRWKNLTKEVRLRDVLWGADIFIQGVPMIKLMVAANLVVWILLWAFK